MSNDIASTFSSFAPDDPAVVAQNQQDNYNTQFDHTDAAGRRNLGIQQGIKQAFGDPLVRRAQSVQDQFKAILSASNDEAADDEDPLDTALRQNQAVARGMVDNSPQMAMAAAANAAKMQEAKAQQSLLTEQTTRLRQSNTAGALSQAIGTVVLAKQGKPGADGTPAMLESVATLDPNDPDFAKNLLKARDDAAKNGDQVIPMSGDQFVNGKQQQAIARGQFQLAAAQQRAMATLEAARIKAAAQGNGMSGNQAMMAYRILSAAESASVTLNNIVQLPLGSNSGYFGTQYGAAPGATLMDMSSGIMRNGLSSQDVQSYNAMATGLARNLAMLEQQGGLQGGQHFSEQIESALRVREFDTPMTALQKLAEARQIIETNTKLYLKNPKLPDAIKDEVSSTLAKLAGAIPFTVNDVTQFRAAQQKNPKMTFSQYANQRGIGLQSFNTEADAEAALRSGAINPGDRVLIGGKKATAQGAP